MQIKVIICLKKPFLKPGKTVLLLAVQNLPGCNGRMKWIEGSITLREPDNILHLIARDNTHVVRLIKEKRLVFSHPDWFNELLGVWIIPPMRTDTSSWGHSKERSP